MPSAAPPIAVHVRRGDMIESRHRATYVVLDADGVVVESAGDIEQAVFPRSSIKPLQALPLIETGAADACAARPEELAVACASHGGEDRHVATVGAWLARLGLSESDLECGAHMPTAARAAESLIRAGRAPTALHNNCSGKHTGMLAACRHMGEPTRGYIAPEHPHQKRIVAVFEAMCGVDLSRAPRGIDGCSLPQIGIPLRALALGLARLGAPDGLAPSRAAACRRIAAAMVAHPFMLAGTGRFCTRAIEAAGGKALVKTGAEGNYIAAVPAKRLGLALKVEDGSTRAAEVAMASLLLRHAGLSETERAAVAALAAPTLTNAAGRIVGGVAVAPGF